MRQDCCQFRVSLGYSKPWSQKGDTVYRSVRGPWVQSPVLTRKRNAPEDRDGGGVGMVGNKGAVTSNGR